MKVVFRRAALALALAALVGTTALVFAQGTPPPPPQRARMMNWQGGPGGPGPMAILQRLNLTDEQRTKIQSLLQQQRQSHQGEMQKQMADLQQQLKNAIFADDGPGGTTALQQQIANLQAQMQADRINLEKQIATILTPDQRKQVRNMPGPGLLMGGPGMGRGRGGQFRSGR